MTLLFQTRLKNLWKKPFYRLIGINAFMGYKQHLLIPTHALGTLVGEHVRHGDNREYHDIDVFYETTDKKDKVADIFFQAKERTDCWIDRFDITPSYQKKNIGRDLYQYIETNFFGKNHCITIGLDGDPNTLEFWKKMGFQPQSSLPKNDFTLMKKQL